MTKLALQTLLKQFQRSDNTVYYNRVTYYFYPYNAHEILEVKKFNELKTLITGIDNA